MAFIKQTLAINEIVYLIGNNLDVKSKINLFLALEINPSFSDIKNLTEILTKYEYIQYNLHEDIKTLVATLNHYRNSYNDLKEKYKTILKVKNTSLTTNVTIVKNQ